MASSKEFSPAEQARRDYQLSLNARNTRSELAAPVIPAIIPGDADGLLDATQIRSVLTVEIPAWPAPPDGVNEYIWLRWAREEDPEEVYEWPMITLAPGTTFPLQLQIPFKDYLQGRLLVSYRNENWHSNPGYSATTLITLDTVPPYANESPENVDIPTDVITDEYLDTNNGQVVLTIPDYPDRAPGDVAYVYWVKDVPNEPGDVPPTLGPIDVNVTREVPITRAILEQVGEGQCNALYVLIDKAGNISRLSYWIPAVVALGPLPIVTDPPVIPFNHDGIIDRVDAFTGVVVQVPEFDNQRNGDLVQVWWGNTPLAVYPTGPSQPFPVEVRVPWEVLKANYDFEAVDPRQPIQVSYQVTRVGLPFPQTPPSTQVHVNFKVVGPDNPDEPNPVNPGLAVLEVRGGSDIPNKLSVHDHGLDATAYIPLNAAAKVGDVIQLFWNKVLSINSHTVDETDVPGETIVEIVIPWTMIEEYANNAQLPVHYTMTDALGINYQESPVTNVEVKVLTITFPAPEFPHITISESGNRVMNCASIREENGEHGFYVYVAPDGKHLKEGVRVTMEWRVTEFPGGEIPVDNTEFTEYVDITKEQEINGITWFVHPYEQYILPAFSDTPLQAGMTNVHFRVTVGDEEITSDYAVEMIGLLSGGGSCPLNTRS